MPQALTTFTNNLKSENLILRQCSGYGIAQIMKLHAESFVQNDVSSVVSALVDLINRPDAREEDNIGGTENALFALGTMAMLPTYRVLPQQTMTDVTSMWLQGMPLREDEQEAKWATMHLASACESWDASIMGGANCANLGHVLRIIAEVIIDANKKKDEDDVILAHPATVNRLRACVKTMQQRSVPQEILSAAFNQLEPSSNKSYTRLARSNCRRLFVLSHNIYKNILNLHNFSAGECRESLCAYAWPRLSPS